MDAVSKSYCPYCRNVKAIFSAMKVDFHADELDQMEDGSQIQKVCICDFAGIPT